MIGGFEIYNLRGQFLGTVASLYKHAAYKHNLPTSMPALAPTRFVLLLISINARGDCTLIILLHAARGAMAASSVVYPIPIPNRRHPQQPTGCHTAPTWLSPLGTRFPRAHTTCHSLTNRPSLRIASHRSLVFGMTTEARDAST